MNKKIIASIGIISLLTACVSNTSIPIDEEVLQVNKIAHTLNIYTSYLYNWPEYNDYKLLSEKVDTKDSSVIYAKECYEPLKYNKSEYNNNSDECILFRRNHGNSNVDFFDYKRFLPKNSSVKTDDDFLLLVNKYKEYKNDENNELKYCDEIYEDNSLTFTERDEKYTQCKADNENKKNKIEELLRSYILEGGLEEEKKQKQSIINAAQSVIADCEQARNQVLTHEENYSKCEKNAESKIDDYKRFIGYDNLRNLNSSYKVVDFAKDGVMIKREYNAQAAQLAYFLTGSIDELNKLYFVYTNDKNYANGDYFRSDMYYIKDGVYKYTTVSGSTNSIQAFKPAKYKISVVENKIKEIKSICGKNDYTYKHFLKDKTITTCKGYYNNDYSSYYCYKDGEKEKCFSEENGVITFEED